MKVLFLDDSYQKTKKYYGCGGFCLDESCVRELANEVSDLKHKFKIPIEVELKWSPDPNHFLRTKFTGDRQELNRAAIELLYKHEAEVICAVVDLKDCYGQKTYGWDWKRTLLWATKQQYRFIVERFEKPYLSASGESGIVIADQYSQKSGEEVIIKDISLAIQYGTEFLKFERISIIPLMTISKYCPPIQIADLIIGVIVSSLAGGSHGLKLFEHVAKLFLKNPYEGLKAFEFSLSYSVLGFGLKLFPNTFRLKGKELFRKLDQEYVNTHEGLKEKVSLDN